MVTAAQRTIYHISSTLASSLGKEYTPLVNTTLNEKFNLLPNYQLEDSKYPVVAYYAIGVGGQSLITDSSNYNYCRHSPVDAALFEHIPFIMVELDNDLSEELRAKYRFRREETWNDIEYACYYLKCIEAIDLRDYFYKISTANGESVLNKFSTSTDKLLNPTPKARTVDTVDISTSNYVCKIAKLVFTITLDEMVELKNVLAIRGIDNNIISEIGICMGVDLTLEDKSIEVVTAQVAYHVDVDINLDITLASASAFTRGIEIGGTEPMVL